MGLEALSVLGVIHTDLSAGSVNRMGLLKMYSNSSLDTDSTLYGRGFGG